MANSQSSDISGFKRDVQNLGEGIDTLKSDVGGLARTAADAARSGVAELKQGARDAVGTAKDKLDDVKASAADTAESMMSVIARNPLASVGIAAGVGLLVGLILSRPRS